MQIKTTIGYIFFNHKTGRGLKIDNGAGKDWELETLSLLEEGEMGSLFSAVGKILKTCMPVDPAIPLLEFFKFQFYFYQS